MLKVNHIQDEYSMALSNYEKERIRNSLIRGDSVAVIAKDLCRGDATVRRFIRQERKAEKARMMLENGYSPTQVSQELEMERHKVYRIRIEMRHSGMGWV